MQMMKAYLYFSIHSHPNRQRAEFKGLVTTNHNQMIQSGINTLHVCSKPLARASHRTRPHFKKPGNKMLIYTQNKNEMVFLSWEWCLVGKLEKKLLTNLVYKDFLYVWNRGTLQPPPCKIISKVQEFERVKCGVTNIMQTNFCQLSSYGITGQKQWLFRCEKIIIYCRLYVFLYMIK